jgi:hypothetical protein
MQFPAPSSPMPSTSDLLVVRADGTTLLSNRRACTVLERTRAELEGVAVDAYLAPLAKLLRPSAHDDRLGKLFVSLPSGRSTWIGFSVGELHRIDAAAEAPAHAVILKDLSEVERVREERDKLLRIATVRRDPPVDRARGEEPARRHRHHRRADGRGGPLGIELRSTVRDKPLLPLEALVVCALVLNLVTNATQACERGGHVDLEAELVSSSGLLPRVVDDGAGMTPDVLARCRELFFTTKTRGTGIGLALCERAVTEIGGSISIDPAPGAGTRLSLNIPLSHESRG